MFQNVHRYTHTHTQKRPATYDMGSPVCSEFSCKTLGQAVTHPQPFGHWPQGMALTNTDSVSYNASGNG